MLDGLDELAEPVRAKAIAALNAELTPADQLILTCRTEEYASAVAGCAGDVLAGAAVIEPVPLKASDVLRHLERCLPPGRAGWPRLFTQLKAEPAGVLARALSTPLTLWLLRKVYVDGRREPSGLCDPSAFPTVDAITEHLLDQLVEAVVSAAAGERRWSAANAERWLGFLADRLDTRGEYDYVARQSVLTPAALASRVRRRLPLRLTAFLADMHRLGLLRRVGPAYQFRHAKLQDRLASAYRSGHID
ncbi:NACHT domain-containing protein [Flindersiella endophytica]